MAETSVKKYVDYAQQQVDEQAILDKYNAATLAQYNIQREQNRANENAFYNQMYNTQKTAMDTIRQSNAAAVASGASRGVQAANELSALLGLQQESVASATELAQANRQTAQEETAAVLENVINAYTQAAQERSQLVSQGIEAASVDAQEAANEIAATEAQTGRMQAETEQARLLTEAAENGTETYLTALQQAGKDYSDGTVTPESQTSLQVALNNIGKSKDGAPLTFTGDDWSGSGTNASSKATEVLNSLNNILDAYGLDKTAYTELFNDFKAVAGESSVSWLGTAESSDKIFAKYGLEDASGKKNYAQRVNSVYNAIRARIQADYVSGANRKSKK